MLHGSSYLPAGETPPGTRFGTCRIQMIKFLHRVFPNSGTRAAVRHVLGARAVVSGWLRALARVPSHRTTRRTTTLAYTRAPLSVVRAS